MTRMGAEGSRRKLRPFGVVALVVLGWVALSWLRMQWLRVQGGKIAAQSKSFKTDYFVGLQKAPQITYLVLGDSTAAGWGAGSIEGSYPYKIAQAIATQGHRVHVINAAVGGATITDVCQTQISSIWVAHPDLISVSVGANDATHGTSDQEYADNMDTLLTTLQNSEAQSVLLANTPDMYQVPALPLPLAILYGRRANDLNGILNKSKIGSKVHIVDLHERGRLVYANDHALYAADLFHPSAKGYAQWADVFVQRWKVAAK